MTRQRLPTPFLDLYREARDDGSVDCLFADLCFLVCFAAEVVVRLLVSALVIGTAAAVAYKVLAPLPLP